MEYVTEQTHPSVRSRQVSTVLRQYREKAGLTGTDAAKALGMSQSKISRMETGSRPLHPDDVAALLGLYQVSEQKRDAILGQVRKSTERGWWESQGLGLPELWKALIDFESRATRIQNYEAMVIPGLLQTNEYTGSMFQAINKTLNQAEVDNLVASRTARQNVLRRQDLHFLAVIDESVLHRPVAERGVMRRQLRHLVDTAERSNVTIRVVPMRVGLHVGLRGAFACLDFAAEPSLVYMENHSTSMFLDEKEDIAAYRVALSNILNVAMKPAESVELISQIAGEHE